MAESLGWATALTALNEEKTHLKQKPFLMPAPTGHIPLIVSALADAATEWIRLDF